MSGVPSSRGGVAAPGAPGPRLPIPFLSPPSPEVPPRAH
jgi:hypothetical protein